MGKRLGVIKNKKSRGLVFVAGGPRRRGPTGARSQRGSFRSTAIIRQSLQGCVRRRCFRCCATGPCSATQHSLNQNSRQPGCTRSTKRAGSRAHAHVIARRRTVTHVDSLKLMIAGSSGAGAVWRQPPPDLAWRAKADERRLELAAGNSEAPSTRARTARRAWRRARHGGRAGRSPKIARWMGLTSTPARSAPGSLHRLFRALRDEPRDARRGPLGARGNAQRRPRCGAGSRGIAPRRAQRGARSPEVAAAKVSSRSAKLRMSARRAIDDLSSGA